MQRLKSRAQFQAVLAGSTVSRTPHFALHQLQWPVSSTADDAQPLRALFPDPVLWLGAMVPKRWAKRAVTRNTIKRQIYAVTGDFAPQLPVAGYVLRLRAGFDRKQFVSATSEALKLAVRTELHTLLSRLTAKPRALPSAPAGALASACAPSPVPSGSGGAAA